MQLDFNLTAKPIPEPKPQLDTKDEGPKSVSELTRLIRDLLEGEIGDVWVEGEVSNMRRQASGHRYFTLKDESSQLSCVLFVRSAGALGKLALEDGIQIEVFGSLSVYEPRGQYQLIVKKARLCGAGALQAKFEALKMKLEKEGLFGAAKKRPLPKFPAQIGLVTSPTGAAIRDFLDVLHRRHPGIGVIVNPVRVQGKGAASEIAAAIRDFSNAPAGGIPPVDVVVVTRGGGSLEDLWEFNEEEVARAVAECSIPVVSAVGHEIDFTICDFASDLRAPTPSAAAELLSADAAEVSLRLAREQRRMVQTCRSLMDQVSLRLATVSGDRLFKEPCRTLDRCRQNLDRSLDDLTRSVRSVVEARQQKLLQGASRLDARTLLVSCAQLKTKTAAHFAQLGSLIRELHANAKNKLGVSHAQLEALNPRATLARGYTITIGPDGTPLKTASDAKAAMRLRTRFVDGEVGSVVED